jgi:hypothetical protein
LDSGYDLPSIALVPKPIEILGDDAELHDQIARKVLRLSLAPFFPPEAQEGGLIRAHYDPGIRPANKASPFIRIVYSLRKCAHRLFLQFAFNINKNC